MKGLFGTVTCFHDEEFSPAVNVCHGSFGHLETIVTDDVDLSRRIFSSYRCAVDRYSAAFLDTVECFFRGLSDVLSAMDRYFLREVEGVFRTIGTSL